MVKVRKSVKAEVSDSAKAAPSASPFQKYYDEIANLKEEL